MGIRHGDELAPGADDRHGDSRRDLPAAKDMTLTKREFPPGMMDTFTWAIECKLRWGLWIFCQDTIKEGM